MDSPQKLKQIALSNQIFICVYNGVPGYQTDNELVQRQTIRKVMVAEIFIIYIIFLILKLVYKNPLRSQKDQNSTKNVLIDQQFDYFENRFMIFYSQHILLNLPAIMYSVQYVSVFFIYLHLLAFIAMLLTQRLKMYNISYFAYGICCAINMINLFRAMGALGKMGYDIKLNLKKLKELN